MIALTLVNFSITIFVENVYSHSVVDCGNQALLLVGLRHTRNAADKRHPYGYGKSVYFFALVSALGTFFMGAGELRVSRYVNVCLYIFSFSNKPSLCFSDKFCRYLKLP